MKNLTGTCTCAALMVLLPQCESINPVSPGPQPIVLEEVTHRPVLDVFAIVRPDSLAGLPLSFVHLEHSYPAGQEPDSAVIADACVQIVRTVEGGTADTSNFTYSNLGVFPTREYRNAAFFPGAGSYHLLCSREGYPALTAWCLLPGLPVIREGTLQRQGDILSLVIVRDDRAGLYEVALEGSGWLVKDRFLRPKSGDLPVSISLDGIPGGSCQLTIYAFDENLAEYLTANLSIKPNIYQKEFSTVENGYGCFGAMNIRREMIAL